MVLKQSGLKVAVTDWYISWYHTWRLEIERQVLFQDEFSVMIVDAREHCPEFSACWLIRSAEHFQIAGTKLKLNQIWKIISLTKEFELVFEWLASFKLHLIRPTEHRLFKIEFRLHTHATCFGPSLGRHQACQYKSLGVVFTLTLSCKISWLVD